MSDTPITDLIAELSPNLSPAVLKAARAAEVSITTNRLSEARYRERQRLKKKRQRSRKGAETVHVHGGQEGRDISSSNRTLNLFSEEETIPQKSPSRDKSDWPVDYKIQFWSNVPRKVEKQDAMRALDKVKRSGVPWAKFFAAVLRYKADAARQELRFVKYPATWLRKGCHEDEPAPPDDGAARAPHRRAGGNAFARMAADDALKPRGESHEPRTYQPGDERRALSHS